MIRAAQAATGGVCDVHDGDEARGAFRDRRPGVDLRRRLVLATLVGVYLMVGSLMFYSGKELSQD